VLVARGLDNSGNALNRAELYNPATNTWSTTGSLAAGRWFFTATLLGSGQVLAAGGAEYSSSPLNSAELYTPAPTGSAVAAPALPNWATFLLAVGLLAVMGWGLRRRGLAGARGLMGTGRSRRGA
jgi:hypothetical protein